MKKSPYNEEQKQRINLSNYAEVVLRQDYVLYGRNTKWTGFLNEIISVYSIKNKISIDEDVNSYRKQLKEALACFDDSDKLNEIIETLVVDYQSKLREIRFRNAPKGESILFRLNNENFNKLYGKNGKPILLGRDYERPSQYLKALLEEFTRLPMSEREALYFRGILREIRDVAIGNNHAVEVCIGSQIFHVRPYKVMQDTGAQHLYLVGKSRNITRHGEEKIASFRISNLDDNNSTYTLLAEEPENGLKKEENDEIEEKIRKVGVQYLVEDSVIIKLRLDIKGKDMYKKKTQQRPVHIDKIGDDVYVFDCTTQQIVNYFFSFGCHAEILEPESLRRALKVGYQRAYELYNNESS